MSDIPRLIDGPVHDPAAILLRSARADNASSGSKDRVRAMLGLVDSAKEGLAAPSPSAMLAQRLHDERVKRASKVANKIAKLIPFQHLISPAKPSATRKVGPILVAFVQVAAMVAALFVRPLPRIDSAPATKAARHDEPELLFFVPRTPSASAPQATKLAKDRLDKPRFARKTANAVAEQPCMPQTRDAAPLHEAIVRDEHAGMVAEHESPSKQPTMVGPDAGIVREPMIFQADMTPPVRLAGTDPEYPQMARLRRVEGVVIMRCVVNEKGLTENCTILKSPAYLDEAVLSATHTWRFTPVKWKGRTVPVQYVFRYKFKLG